MRLKKEFEDFYKDIRIDSETDVLIEKRETLEGEIKDKLPEVNRALFPHCTEPKVVRYVVKI